MAGSLQDNVWWDKAWLNKYSGGSVSNPTTPTNPTPVNPGTPAASIFTVVRNDLPFNVAPDNVLHAGTRDVIAHKFLTFRPAFTSDQSRPGSPDVDTRFTDDGSPYGTPLAAANQWGRFLPPSYGAYAAYGGLVRDRPILERAPRATIDSPTLPGKKLDYRVQDQMTLIQQALLSGVNVWAIDVIQAPGTATEYDLSLTSPSNLTYWRACVEVYEACAEINRQAGKVVFRIMPMFDGSTSGTRAPASIQVNAIDYLLENYPSTAYFRKGFLVICPFAPEASPAGTNGANVDTKVYWTGVLDGLRALGYNPTFIPCHTRDMYAAPQFPKFASMSSGVGRWGSRDAFHTAGENINNRQLVWNIKTTYGQAMEVMVPVSVSDERPNPANNNNVVGIYDESNHFRQWIESWKTAIADDGDPKHVPADFIQLPTADDYGEGAMVLPTWNKGWCVFDTGLYWLQRYKTGQWPEILRPTIYLSHRISPTPDVATMTYTGPQTVFMTKRSGTAAQNTVCVLAFLPTGTWTVNINVGGRVVPNTVNSLGKPVEIFVPLLPIGTGLISASALNAAGDVVAQIPAKERYKVRTTLVSEDLGYRMRSSRPKDAFGKLI